MLLTDDVVNISFLFYFDLAEMSVLLKNRWGCILPFYGFFPHRGHAGLQEFSTLQMPGLYHNRVKGREMGWITGSLK